MMYQSPQSLSYWERESFFGNIDVAVIGSGIVGLNAAIRLKEQQPTLRVVILEKGALPEGASTRNAGFACFGSLTELLEDLEYQSADEVFTLVERRWRGLARLRERVGDTQLQYEEYGGYEIFQAQEKDSFEACRTRMDYFNHELQKITQLSQTYRISDSDFGFAKVAHQIHNVAEGQINTGQMMLGLLALAKTHAIPIINGLGIQSINEDNNDGVCIISEQGWEIRAQKALVCTNGFAKQLIPNLAVNAARNQVLITKPINNLRVRGCFHYDRGYFYCRNVGDRVLLGGGRNLAPAEEATHQFGTTPLIQDALINLLDNVILPDTPYEIDMWWSGILGLGTIKKPIIEMLSQNIGVAVRMGGMGVAIGSLVGEDAADMLLATS